MSDHESDFAAPLYTDVDRVSVGIEVTRYIVFGGEIAVFDITDQATIRACKALESPKA